MKKGLMILGFAWLIAFNVQASICKGHFINPITDICWDCLFPLTIGSSKVVKGSYPDTDSNPKNIVCQCTGETGPRFGLSIGYWEPFALVDVTRSLGISKPLCININQFILHKFMPNIKNQFRLSKNGGRKIGLILISARKKHKS